LRFADIQMLNYILLEGDILRIRMGKTNKPITIPLKRKTKFLLPEKGGAKSGVPDHFQSKDQ
jgi:hypothetical protein